MGACGGGDECGGSDIGDPGEGRRANVFGEVETDQLEANDPVTPVDDIVVDGQPIEIDRQTRREGLCATRPDGGTDCVAHVTTADDGTASHVRFWSPASTSLPVAPRYENLRHFEITSNRYRIADTTLVVDDGLELTIADDVRVWDCDYGEAQSTDALMDGRFGATFVVSWDTGEVIGASCNGCH